MRRLVAKALEIARENVRLLTLCMPYGADITALRESMKKLSSRPE